jgi:hypothetical protein
MGIMWWEGEAGVHDIGDAQVRAMGEVGKGSGGIRWGSGGSTIWSLVDCASVQGRRGTMCFRKKYRPAMGVREGYCANNLPTLGWQMDGPDRECAYVHKLPMCIGYVAFVVRCRGMWDVWQCLVRERRIWSHGYQILCHCWFGCT